MSKEAKINPSNLDSLKALFANRNMPDDDLLISLGLYLRSSALIKILFINELYQEIRNIPGSIMEFGCWRGQNLVVFENLRAIYEPFNQRPIVGFDTFTGHSELGNNDKPCETLAPESYTLPDAYVDHLRSLLAWHQGNSILKGAEPHDVILGDVEDTLPSYLHGHPALRVALAYLDMGLYEPTLIALREIKPFLASGSVIMLDEYANANYPGETKAFHEVFNAGEYSVKKSLFMPDRTIVRIR